MNCECELAGLFCHECGQTASIGRYSIKRIGTEIYEQLRKIDALTTLRTFWLLTTKPADFVTGYLAGRRVGFLNPVKFFFYSFMVQVLFGTFARWLTHDQQFESLAKLDSRIEFVGLISTIFWGGLWALMFRKSDLNLVENMASALFFVGQANFYSVVLDAISMPLHSVFPTFPIYLLLADVVVVIGYGFFFARKVFGEPWYLIVPKHLFLSVLYLITTILVSMGGAILTAIAGASLQSQR